eukprot:jgi/Tetstr1/425178/TSEL_015639.t1
MPHPLDSCEKPRVVRVCALRECDETFTRLRCAKCKTTWYCCREHQKQDWQEHKQNCVEPDVFAVGSMIRESDIAAVGDGMGPRPLLRTMTAYRKHKIQEEEAACTAKINEVQRRLQHAHQHIAQALSGLKPGSTARRSVPEHDGAAADRLEQDVPALEHELRRLERTLGDIQVKKERFVADVQSSVSWECYESGLETRDVLSNGERKADMEELLGRKVASREFEWEANLPAPERLRLMQERRRALQDRQRLTEG